MGILNVTPDSFFDGGKYTSVQQAVDRAGKMLSEGARFIDIGGQSTRPGADMVGVKEELIRVLPAVEAIAKDLPEALISIDTFNIDVAEAAVKSGAHIVNDISGGQFDLQMFTTVAQLQVPYILMHIQGTPENMQKNPVYEKNVVDEIYSYFFERLAELHLLGVGDVILDPGIGFGKTVNHNLQLLKRLEEFQFLNCPVLVGLSRKSVVNKILNIKSKNALNGTSALHMYALQNGANILRVHDVKEARECLLLAEAYKNCIYED